MLNLRLWAGGQFEKTEFHFQRRLISLVGSRFICGRKS